MITNEQIKASEVRLTGVDGEDLGIVSRDEALALARRLKVDLVCESLFSSPPPCRLIGRGEAKMRKNEAARAERQAGGAAKVKELRLTPHIEEHDYDTKLRQAEKLLLSGHPVQFVARLAGAKEGAAAKELLERLAKDLASAGRRKTGIQVSGKQAAVQLDPL
ncbi:translation initiation factor IF-3 [Cohnella fermenti]|uniref:Translation initiation factor IF-3 n=1 Tax=Cohnella fermenti TaxID=2565925 RepID=A0A4S4BU40_9BACL|nr:translation initiation factor IF-3 [Cohnella fermenti]THF78060.1 translation initiation factor IF-3 [Cohnella fermenti]